MQIAIKLTANLWIARFHNQHAASLLTTCTNVSQQADSKMRWRSLRQLVDDKSAVICEQTCCKLSGKTCSPQVCSKFFQQVATSLILTGLLQLADKLVKLTTCNNSTPKHTQVAARLVTWYTRKNLTTCNKSADKPSTRCVRTACTKFVNKFFQTC